MPRYCSNPLHVPGEHDATCVPPADPTNPELRLLRAIFGLCPLCDKTENHNHTVSEYLSHGMVPAPDDPEVIDNV